MPRKIYYGGRTFGQTELELRIRIEGEEYHRYITFAGTPWNDHLVLWMFVANSPSERSRLVNSALTIRFLKEKKP